MSAKLKNWLNQPDIIKLVDEERFCELLRISHNNHISREDHAKLCDILYECGYLNDAAIWNESFIDFVSTKSVCIPDGVTIIKGYTFWLNQNLVDVSIPSSVRRIIDRSFKSCTSLTNIVIPEGVQEMGHDVFGGCTSLKSVSLPSTLKKIGSFMFNGCTHLVEITFSGTVEQWTKIEIGEHAFDTVPTSVVRCTDGVTRTQ